MQCSVFGVGVDQKMPRKSPTEVIEHRISFSNFERDLIVETLEKNRESRLYEAGVSQIGSVVGSSVLLWGIGAYLGIQIIDDVVDATKKWVNNTSSKLADVVGGFVGIPTTAQAEYIRQGFDALDAVIVEMRDRENANRARFDGGMALLRSGDITYDEFYNDYFIPVKAEEEQINIVRGEVVEARQRLIEYRDAISEQQLFGDGDISNIDILRMILAFSP